MKKYKLTRRDFLKVAGVTSASLALSACGMRATELPEPTVTALSSLTPIPPTATVTNTPVPTATLGVSSTLKEIGQRHGIIIMGDYSRDDKGILPHLPDWININFNGVTMQDVRPIQLKRAMDDNTGDNGWEYVRRVTKVLKEMQLPSLWYYLAEPGRFEHLKTLEAFKYHARRTLDEIKYVGKFVYWNAFNEPGDGGYDLATNPLASWLGKDWLYQLYLILDELALERGLIIGKDFATMVNLFFEPSMTDVMRKDYDFVADTNVRLGNIHSGWMAGNQGRWAHDGKLSGRAYIEPSSTEEMFGLCNTLAEINPRQPIVFTELQSGQNDTPQQRAEILGTKIGEIIRWSDEKKVVGQSGVAALYLEYFLTTCYQPENIQFCYGNAGFFDTTKGQLTDAGRLLIETINTQLA